MKLIFFTNLLKKIDNERYFGKNGLLTVYLPLVA